MFLPAHCLIVRIPLGREIICGYFFLRGSRKMVLHYPSGMPAGVFGVPGIRGRPFSGCRSSGAAWCANALVCFWPTKLWGPISAVCRGFLPGTPGLACLSMGAPPRLVCGSSTPVGRSWDVQRPSYGHISKKPSVFQHFRSTENTSHHAPTLLPLADAQLSGVLWRLPAGLMCTA